MLTHVLCDTCWSREHADSRYCERWRSWIQAPFSTLRRQVQHRSPRSARRPRGSVVVSDANVGTGVEAASGRCILQNCSRGQYAGGMAQHPEGLTPDSMRRGATNGPLIAAPSARPSNPPARDALHPAAFTTIAALARAATRELCWGLRATSREVVRWRSFASRIPDDTLRHDALAALDRKRPHIYGSALFWTVPHARSPDLLRLLVAYDILGDFLDEIDERVAHAGIRNGMQLQSALTEALDPSLPISDHYRYHPWRDDGGYMRALVDACRHGFISLPSHETVAPLLSAHAAEMVPALALNHEPQIAKRIAALQAWAEANPLEGVQLNWFERVAVASSWVPVLPLLALAAEPGLSEHEAVIAMAGYTPWVSCASALLDSYADIEDDGASGTHSYVAYYETDEQMTERLADVVTNSLRGVAAIRDGSGHLVIVGCMIAMYLSKDRQRTPANMAQTARIIHAGGPLVGVLMPIVRAWRTIYGLRAS